MSLIALQRNRYPDVDIDFALRQIEGWQRARKKLPSIALIEDWWYPQRVSTEQCSSEMTAGWKAAYLQSLQSRLNRKAESIVDLTGGMGIDTMWLSSVAKKSVYVERDEELCRLARHNFKVAGKNIEVVCSSAEDYLERMDRVDCIYIDPSRRDSAGRKVYQLEDCSPDIVKIQSALLRKCGLLLLKLSPMLDIEAALRVLEGTRDVNVLAVEGEVKELLLCVVGGYEGEAQYRALNLGTGQPEIVFTRIEEQQAAAEYASAAGKFLYEPNAAVMKAGCFRLIGNRYGLKKLAANTHLYTSDELVSDFCGRRFEVMGIADKRALRGRRLSVLSRNYPLTAEQIKSRYGLREDDREWLVATRIGNKQTLLTARKI